MIAFLKNFFQKYFYDDEHYAAVFFLFIGLIILYFFGGILAPILISILIAYLLNGLMTFLENKGNSKILSLSITLIFFSIFYFSIFLLFPFLSRQILLLVSDIPQIFETVNLFLSSQLKEYSDIFSENQINEVLANSLNYIPTILQNALLQLNSGFSTIMNAILYLIIIPFLVFFLLKDKDYFLENLKFSFFGNKDKIIPLINSLEILRNSNVIHTDQIIDANEKPSTAVRKGKNSSMGMAIQLVKSGKADAVVSAGNTGALMAMSKLILRPMDGITRPAISAYFPTIVGESCMLDLGANIECDENKHKHVDYSCENKRIMELSRDFSENNIHLSLIHI